MKVWTVASQDDTDKGSDHLVAGSYTSRGRALDECVKYVFERIALRGDITYGMAHDENHPEAAKLFSERRSDGATVVRRGCTKRLWSYVRDVLGQDGAYYVYDGTNSWHFDVDENDVEGELWTTVTWGDSDCEDPAFTTPKPEAFTSRETAVKTFVDYVRELFKSHDMEFGDTERDVRAALDADGTCQVDLDDGCCVSCVLYHDDAKNVKE